MYTKEQILDKVQTDQKWLERAIIAIYDRQTTDEKATEDTIYHNKKGFKSCHAKRGSYYAKWILSGKHLTDYHVEKAKKMIKPYIGQLLKVIKEKEESHGSVQRRIAFPN